MKKILKWTGIILGGLILILACAAFYFKTKFENLANRSYTTEVETINIPSDSVSLARGKLLSVGCRECHGHDLAGKDLFSDPMIGYMSSPNITGASGSATEYYKDIDYIRTLRHCLDPDGRALMVMPSESIGLLSDEDLASLIAYLKTVEHIERVQGPTNFTLMAKIMAGAGLFGDLYPYDIIDHQAVAHIKAPAKSSLSEYGAYMTRFHGCATCHGKNFAGGISPDPASPPVPNITPAGNIGRWSVNQFKESMRSGKTPEDKIIDAKFMPWPGIGVHDDQELEALYTYLKSLPGIATDPKLQKQLDKVKATATN